MLFNEAWWPSGLSRLLSNQASPSVGSNPADGRPRQSLRAPFDKNLSATFPMTTSDAETDVKLKIKKINNNNFYIMTCMYNMYIMHVAVNYMRLTF